MRNWLCISLKGSTCYLCRVMSKKNPHMNTDYACYSLSSDSPTLRTILRGFSINSSKMNKFNEPEHSQKIINSDISYQNQNRFYSVILPQYASTIKMIGGYFIPSKLLHVSLPGKQTMEFNKQQTSFLQGMLIQFSLSLPKCFNAFSFLD